MLAAILKIIGHPEAFISDRSCLDDFGFEVDEMNLVVKRIGAEFGIDAPGGDEYLVDIAKRTQKVRGRQ